jgi:hypothetical protein
MPTDRQLLDQGICPDCKQVMRHWFVSQGIPWCQACDQYYTVLGGHVVRNTGAMRQYNEEWEGLTENGRWAEPADASFN